MQNSKKILFVHHNSVPGGAELSLYDLVTNLSPGIVPVCAAPEGPLLDKFSAAGIKTYAVPMRPLTKSLTPFKQLTSGYVWLKVHSQIKKICGIESIRIIHANSLTAAIYTAKAAKTLKLPLIWHERDMAVHSILTPQVAKFATRIIAISNAVAENLNKQLGKSDKVKMIHNGIDLAKFENPPSGDMPALPDNQKKVLMAGQFVEWKGHKDFIEASALVKNDILDTVFILAGDTSKPEQQNYIRELESAIAGKDLIKDFIFTGFVENMPGLLNQVDCIVVPSHGEPFGRIVVEAMAAGKPIAGYKCGALPELLEDGVSGCLVEHGAKENLAKKICEILKDNDFSKILAKQAKLRVSQKFTIKQTVSQFEKIVNEIQ